MKTTFTFLPLLFCFLTTAARPAQDTTLKEQKENIIKEATIAV
jgi:hypothetical protein